MRTMLKSLSQDSSSANISDDEYLSRQVAKMNMLAGDMDDGFSCEMCGNKGNVFVVENSRIISRECSCMTQRRNLRRLRQSGLMGTVERCTFDAYTDTEDWQKRLKRGTMDFVRNIESLKDKWMFVGGGVGSGKTHLCTAVAMELMLDDREVRYMLWVDESQRIKACTNDAVKYTELVDPLKNAEVLYIDDFFKNMPTAADIRLAYEIINHRYQDGNLITIISSEKHISEIEEIDSAVGSRIYERAKGHTFNLKKDKSRNYRIRDMNVF